MDIRKCTCGAQGDEGEMVEHSVSALHNPDDPRDHRWVNAEEPERVVEARMRDERCDQTRRKLAEAAGVTMEELREVLG